MDKDSYKKQIDKLSQNIIDIEKRVHEKTISKAEASDKIMELMRSQTLFVNKEYILAAHSNPKATLDPDDVRLKLKLTDDDFVTEWYHICANSFGPFNPAEYFKDNNFRVLWLLKESYIMKESWVKGDRGGHNQAHNNRIWNAMEENPTLENVIQRTLTILNEVTGKTYAEQEAMNHICILEVTHFPGLAFNSYDSDDSKIGEWAENNAELIKCLISFYAPNVIIGGNTIGYFYCGIAQNKHYLDDLKNSIINGNPLLQQIGLKAENIIQPNGSSSYLIIARCSNNNVVYVLDAYHPCPKRNKDYEYTPEIAMKDARAIKSIEDENKTGSIKSPRV